MSMHKEAGNSTRALTLAWVLTMAACGGGSGTKSSPGGTGGAGPANVDAGGGTDVVVTGTPVQQCKQLATLFCSRGAQCTSTAADPTCDELLNVEFGCDRATGGDFATCIQDSQSVSCASLFPSNSLNIPSACDAPLNAVPLSDPQSKCLDLVDALCMRVLQCNGTAVTAANIQVCEDSITTDTQNGLVCILATSVGATYSQCLAAIPSIPCASPGADGGADSGAAAADGGMSMMNVTGCDTAITTLQ